MRKKRERGDGEEEGMEMEEKEAKEEDRRKT